MVTAPTVSIGGVPATVVYAGFAPDSIAGLYQINVTLPGTNGGPFTLASGSTLAQVTAPVQLPVSVTTAGITSQTGVNVWVAPRLKVTGPAGAGLTSTVGIPCSTTNNVVIAAEGTATYRYAVTSGLLPSGLSLNPANGAITGVPAANTAGAYAVTLTATDSANIPVTGSVTFTLNVAGGLFMTSTNTAPFSGTFATAAPSLTNIAATGGVFPYTYAITSPSTLPTGLSVNPSTGVVGFTALTPAGTYHVTVTASDSTTGTPLTGSITFDIVIGLKMAKTIPVAGTNGTASTISTISATGNTGTVTYSLDATSAGLSWLQINSSTGVVSTLASAPASTTVNAVVTATDGTSAPGASAAAIGSIPLTITVN